MTEFRYIVLTKCPNLSPDHNTDYNSQTETTRKYDNQTQKKRKKKPGILRKLDKGPTPEKKTPLKNMFPEQRKILRSCPFCCKFPFLQQGTQ